MNQIVPLEPRVALDLAKAFSEAKLVPAHFRKSVGDCYIAVNLANRYGMDPWTLMQELYIIQDKPMMSGKLVIAILNNSLAEPLRPIYSGEGDDREITLSARPEGSPEALTVKLKVRDARTSNEQWKKNPDQMLMYAAARMWGRRYTPDVILGIVFDDEEITSPSLVPKVDAPRTTIASPAEPSGASPALIDGETGEVIDTPISLGKNPGEDWRSWGQRLIAGIRSARDIDTVDEWLRANSDALFDMREEKIRLHETLMHNVEQHKLSLMPGSLP